MKKLFVCLALVCTAPVITSLHAQEGQQQPPEQYEPPPPVGVDIDYYAPPKQKLSVGFHVLTGPKLSLRNSGPTTIPSGFSPGAENSLTGTRTYNDGTISPDTRQKSDGSAVNDGNTNHWSFTNISQKNDRNVPGQGQPAQNYTPVSPDNTNAGGVDMHTYSASVNQSAPLSGRAPAGAGFELTFARDFGWHLGKLQISLIGGLGMNKISYSHSQTVAATLNTVTDEYATYNTNIDTPTGDPLNAAGQRIDPSDTTQSPSFTQGTPKNQQSTGVAPTDVQTPYTAPSSTTDLTGNSVTTSTLIGSNPINGGGGIASQTSNYPVLEHFSVVGSYFTLRAGAQLSLPITEKFTASVSGGPAMIYSGTTFTVDQTFTPPTGDPVSSSVAKNYNTVLPAAFADADIEYSLTDRTGLYLGAEVQSSSSYNQSIHSSLGNYAGKVNFGTQAGVNGGISFKF